LALLSSGIAIHVPANSPNHDTGGLIHAVKGFYKGATEGFMAGLSYPNYLYSEYFSVINDNEELLDHIEQLSSKKCDLKLLRSDEIELFKSTLNDSEGEELEKELAKYKSYVNNICPITKKKVKEHNDPLVIRINDKQSQTDIIKIYNRAVFFRKLHDNMYRVIKNTETDCILKKDNAISVGFPEEITNFVEMVRARLHKPEVLSRAKDQLLSDYELKNLQRISSDCDLEKNLIKNKEKTTNRGADILSRIGGAFVGLFTGLFSGMALGTGYI
jgi:hypothetical protein